jgi:hypothetical protein
MKQKFTPTPLCGVNGVNYDIKNIHDLVILPLVPVLVCDFTHVYYCYVIMYNTRFHVDIPRIYLIQFIATYLDDTQRICIVL